MSSKALDEVTAFQVDENPVLVLISVLYYKKGYLFFAGTDNISKWFILQFILHELTTVTEHYIPWKCDNIIHRYHHNWGFKVSCCHPQGWFQVKNDTIRVCVLLPQILGKYKRGPEPWALILGSDLILGFIGKRNSYLAPAFPNSGRGWNLEAVPHVLPRGPVDIYCQ